MVYDHDTRAAYVALLVYRTSIDGNHEILVSKPTSPPGTNGIFQIPSRIVGENQTQTEAVRVLSEWNLGFELTQLESALVKSLLVTGDTGTKTRCFFHRSKPMEYLKLSDLVALGRKYQFVPVSTFAAENVALPDMELDQLALSDLLHEFIALVARDL